MLSETYKGRKLRVRKIGPGGLVGEINGQPMPARYGAHGQEIIAQLRRDVGGRLGLEFTRRQAYRKL